MQLKFITLNLWLGGILQKDILEFLKKEKADVVVLQEVYSSPDTKIPPHNRSLEFLSELGYPYQDFAPALVDDYPWGKITEGNAVLSRFPIKESNVTFFDKPFDPNRARAAFDPATYPTTPRNLEHVVLDTPAGDVNVFNLQGVWDLNGDNFSPQRQQMSEVIIREIKGKANVILAGDTNAKYTNPAMRAIEEYLTNIFGDSLTTTFNVKRKDNPGYATAVVDMIYVSPTIKVIEKSCPDIDVSDHLPLVTTLQIPKVSRDALNEPS